MQKCTISGCNRPKILNRSICTYHTIRYSLFFSGSHRSKWRLNQQTYQKHKLSKQEKRNLILQLIKQLYKHPYCPYTGEKIALGNNASLDHRIAVRTNPNLMFDLSNLQWVSSVYNHAKGCMTDEEFNSKYILRKRDS
jgi:hypothetical protein